MFKFNNKENLTQNEQMDDAGHIWAQFYATSGEKCKIIGTQDGWFPDFGHHVRLEMGGIWVHPIKLMDGFWTRVNGEWLVAEEYHTLPHCNRFTYHQNGVAIARTQLSPDRIKGAIIRYDFSNTTSEQVSLKVETAFKFDLSPVWNSDKLGIVDGDDTAEYENGVIVAHDTANPWHAVVTASPTLSDADISDRQLGPIETAGKGTWAMTTHNIVVNPNESAYVEYYIAGSWHSAEEAIAENTALQGNYDCLLAEKVERYRRVKSNAQLVTSDIDFNKAYEWVKYNNEWLIQDSGEFGRAPMAGIPEYTWWFGCDNSYSLQGILGLGAFDVARDTLLLLCESSERKNGNGRIVHEITTFGEISNPGNTQETAHYITAVHKYLKWTNDLETVKRIYPYCVKGIDWLLNEMDPDGDLLPSGYGIIEIAGLNVELTDSAVYTCQALYNMHEMSSILGTENTEWLTKAQLLQKKINDELFLDEHNLYAEAVGTPRQLIDRIPQIKSQYGKRCKETEEYFSFLDNLAEKLSKLDPDKEIPFLVNRSWVINTPMETGLADVDKAAKALATMRGSDFVNDLGVYLSGYARDSVMTISTGVQAVAEGRYGNVDQSLELLQKIAATMGAVMPGSINEMSPDYGCFTQEWTVYSMVVPVVECFAGISPNAQNKTVSITPMIPSKWDIFSLTGIKVGDNIIDIEYTKRDGVERYYITSALDWTVKFTAKSDAVTLNGKTCDRTVNFGVGTHCIEITGE